MSIVTVASRRSGSRALLHVCVLAFTVGVAPACVTFPDPTVGAPPPPRNQGPPGWRVRTRDHVDLWLHGFALLQRDSATLSLFRPGYADRVRAAKDAAGVYSVLDANAETLTRGLAENPGLVNAHFVPLYFASWLDTREAAETFLAAGGDVRRARDGDARFRIALLAQLFPTAADRDWLRLFVNGLDDERAQFHQRWWDEQQRENADVLAVTDSILRAEIDGRLRPYLRSSLLDRGDVALSWPLGGEGRSVLRGTDRITIAVTRPATRDSAVVAVYAFVHEIVAPAVDLAIREQDAPDDSLRTLADMYTTSGLVRGGLILLQRTAPELADGYARYYLHLAGRQPTADPQAGLARIFPLPAAIAQDIEQQIAAVLRGI